MLCLYLIIRMFAVAHATICIGLRRYIQKEMLIDEGAVLGRHVLMEPPEQLKALQLLQMTNTKIGFQQGGFEEKVTHINYIIYKFIFIYNIIYD